MVVVEVADTNQNVNVSDTEVIVEVGPSTVLTSAIGRRVRVLGSSFTGSTGDSSRDYTYAFTVNGKEIVSVGGRILDPSTDYSLSTNSVSNDTITITDALFDDEVVLLWQ